MSDPLRANDTAEALRYIAAEAERYLASLADRPVRPAHSDAVAASLDGGVLPEQGDGTMRALAGLVAASDGALASAGPRFFHWVTGGSTPAAIAADWFTSVERHLSLAQRIASRVDGAPELERLAEVPLNIVCFRYRANGIDETALDALNARIGAAILEDGRVYVGTTRYGGKTAFRPAISNWRTTEADVDLLVDIVLELGAREAARSVQ